MANIDLSGVIKAAVTAAVIKVAESPSNSLKQPEVAAAAKTVTAAVTPVIEKEAGAILTNATNQEPLWKSRNMWTFGFTMLAMVMAAAGYTFSAEDQSKAVEQIMQLMQIVPIIAAGGASLWGMWNRIFVASKKPLGS